MKSRFWAFIVLVSLSVGVIAIGAHSLNRQAAKVRTQFLSRRGDVADAEELIDALRSETDVWGAAKKTPYEPIRKTARRFLTSIIP